MTMTNNEDQTILAFDYGDVRIGVARVNTVAKIPEPLDLIRSGDNIALEDLITKHNPTVLVVGLPRGLDGLDTAQTKASRDFAKSLEKYNLEIVLQDEALSSVEAEKRAAEMKKPASIDSLAAMVILEDYIRERLS